LVLINYHIAQNVGGGNIGKFGDCPNFSNPNFINTLKCNGTLTKFAKVFPSKYTDGMISPKFYAANILHYSYGIFTTCLSALLKLCNPKCINAEEMIQYYYEVLYQHVIIQKIKFKPSYICADL